MLLALSGAICAQAQFQRATKANVQAQLRARGADKATITPQSNQAWWGYVAADAPLESMGVGEAETYDCAVYIPYYHDIAGGKTINAIRFAMKAKNVSDVKVWIAEAGIPTDINTSTVRMVNVSELDESGFNDVALPEPYALTDKGIYVGYSFTITKLETSDDAYPILFTGDPAVNTLWVRTSTSVPNWGDLYGYGFGRLFLQVLLEGDFDIHNGATPSAISEVVMLPGQQGTTQVSLTNNGINDIKSIDYTVSVNNVAGAEQHFNLKQPISLGSTGSISLPIDAGQPGTVEQRTLTITKVNGVANETATNSIPFTACTVLHDTPHGIAVEEYTGTTCGWCPRGLIGMEKMRQQFGDAFVGIGIHQFTSSLANDAMFISAYTQVSFDGAPSCRLNRGEIIDPYYGSSTNVLNDFSAALAIPAKAGLTLTADWNADSTSVIANAEIEALVDGNFAIEYVLIADGLTGTTQPWRQYNYYHRAYGEFDSASELPADLAFLFNTGQIFNNSYVAYYPVFNDVAIAVAKQNQTTAPGQLTSGQKVQNSYTLSLPSASNQKELISALDATGKGNIAVVALLIDKADNKIANATKFYMPVFDPATTTIEGISSQEPATEVSRFAADGRQLSAPQRGLNIVRMADGTTRKVLVK